jgi:hypothetical protein
MCECTSVDSVRTPVLYWTLDVLHVGQPAYHSNPPPAQKLVNCEAWQPAESIARWWAPMQEVQSCVR